MFTVSDIIHLIQYYYHHTSSYDNAATDVETFRLESLRGMYSGPTLMQGLIAVPCSDIEKSLGVATPPLIHEHPSATLYDAAQRLIQTHARRLPLLDNDSETGHQVIVSVLTQYRLLKFIAINVMLPSCILSLPFSSRRSATGTFSPSIFLSANSASALTCNMIPRRESPSLCRTRITLLRLPPWTRPCLMLFTCSRNVASPPSP
jgi:5'-AMP-activated protein kinase regulatory gamma subunit